MIHRRWKLHVISPVIVVSFLRFFCMIEPSWPLRYYFSLCFNAKFFCSNVVSQFILVRLFHPRKEIFDPILISPSLSVGIFKNGQILIIMSQITVSLFKHNCVKANSIWGETVGKCKSAKITWGKNNPVYSICCCFRRSPTPNPPVWASTPTPFSRQQTSSSTSQC